MKQDSIRWRWVVAVVVGLEVILIATAFAWVAFYSLALRPGEPDAYYEAYAQWASPIVSLVAGAPLFYAMGRWLRRRIHDAALRTAMAVAAIYVTIDLVLIVTWPGATGYHAAMLLANALLKPLAAYAGARGQFRAASTAPC